MEKLLKSGLKASNLALEFARLEINTFIKRGAKEMLGFGEVAQNGNFSPGAPKAGNEHLYKEM